MPLRLILIVPNPFLRTSLASALAALPDMTLRGALAGLAPALAQRWTPPVDVLLVDVEALALDPDREIRVLRCSFPDAELVLLGPKPAAITLLSALKAGANGYLPREVAPPGLARALRSLRRGEPALPRSYARFVVDALQREAGGPSGATTLPTACPRLSRREREVLLYIGQGYSNAAIARALVMSIATVKTHVSHILAKTGRRSRHVLGMIDSHPELRPPA